MSTNRTTIVIVLLIYLVSLFFILEAIGNDKFSNIQIDSEVHHKV
jgi:thioredoxin-related protein